jgi:hypothetical protein
MSNLLERLMALLDGELPPAEAEAVIREAAGADNLRGLLEICYRTRRRIVAEPYDFMATEPAPARLSKPILRAPAAAGSAEPARQASYGRALLVRLKERYRAQVWPLAASHAMAMVLAVVASVWLLLPAVSQERAAMEQLRAALESMDGSKASAVASVRAVRTFRSKTDEWCRQYEVSYGASQVSHGLGCRSADGNWRVLAATAPGPRAFVPAEGGQENPRKPIDDRVHEIRSGEDLDRDSERELVTNGWGPAGR